MNLKTLLDTILSLGSNISIKEGKEIHKSKLVSNLNSKKIDNVYHIYSKVSEEDESRVYSCHIKYDLMNEKVIGTTCTCNTYEEFSRYKKNYVCKHIIATIFSFYIIAKNKIKKHSNEIKGVKKIKETATYFNKEIRLDLEIKSFNEKNNFILDIQFRIGEGKTYLIPRLNEFFNARESKNPLRINGEFLFNPNNMKFSKDDEEILNFVFNKLKTDNEVRIIENKYLRLGSNDIRAFLSLINKDKKIKLNYDYINYESNIYNENIPLSFTLKLENETINLTTKKKLPIPLSNKFDVFLYDRKVYIPNINQSNKYFEFWKELRKEGKIEYNSKDIEFIKKVKTLSEISKDVSITEGIRRVLRKFWVPKMIFSKSDNTIKCKAVVSYFNRDINILDNENKEFFREQYLEDKIDRSLERTRFIKKNKEYVFIGTDDEYYHFITEGIKELGLISKISFSKNFKNGDLIRFEDIEATIEEEEENLYFKFNIENIDFSEYKDILQALNEGKSYYKSKKNKLIDLKGIGMRNFLNMLDNLVYNKELNEGILEIDKNKTLFLENAIQENGLSFIRGNEIIKSISDKLSNRKDYEIDDIKGLKGKLRSYQLIGVNYLKSLSDLGFGGILADEMGLGKTIQIISFLLSQKELEEKKQSLIVAPTSLLYNWKAEFEKFAPQINIGIIHGSKSNRFKVINNINEYDVLLTTYGTIKNDIDFYENKIFDYCIIDEAQNIKNPKSQNTKVIKKINAKIKFALTGTPIENSLIELWSIFDFIMPGYLFDELVFKEKFVNSTKEKIEELKLLINPFILRRLKKDVILELPEKIERKYYVQMTPEQKLAYKNCMKDVKLKLKQGEEDKIAIFSYLTRLRQICLDPSLVNKEYKGKSGKFMVATDVINDVITNGYKILVFSQFTSVLDSIKTIFDAEGIEYFYLDGSTKASERVSLVNEFNNSNKVKVFLISLKAGGTGLNLTSADVVIHFDPWWNPAIEDQATDRAHRFGQKNVVEVIKLISKGSIEEKIIKLQESKKEIINEIMNGNYTNGGFLSSLDADEIKELFS